MKNNILFSVLTLLFFSSLCIAQPDYSQLMGAIFDQQTDKASIEALLSNYSLGSKGEDLPMKYSLIDYAHTPRKQPEGTCVGEAVRNALSIAIACQDSITDERIKEENLLSSSFIYNSIQRYGCKRGALIPDAMQLIKDKGSCRTSTFESIENDCNKLPGEEAFQEAIENKIKDYISVFPAKEDGERKVFKTKEQLVLGVPIVIGMKIPGSFLALAEHDFSKPIELLEEDSLYGGHAMCVIGYNDYMEAFEVMNSWGTEWGNGGFFWLKYTDYARYVKYGFAPIMNSEQYGQDVDTEKPTITLTGEFAFRTPNGFDENSNMPVFQEKTPEFGGNNYTIKDWKRLKVYQLIGRGMKHNSYTYVFSIDAQNKTELHFPKSVAVPSDSLLTADRVSLKKAIVQRNNTNIIIPSELYALQTIHKGTDNICVIYSHYEIPDIQERIERTKNTEARNIQKRIQAGFGDILIPAKDIDYNKDSMAFTATSDKGIAVPIILEVIVE